MINDPDTAYALAALSARVIALEGAVAALATQHSPVQHSSLTAFDQFATETLDRYVGLPVEEGFLTLLRQSFEDIRSTLAP